MRRFRRPFARRQERSWKVRRPAEAVEKLRRHNLSFCLADGGKAAGKATERMIDIQIKTPFPVS